MKLRLTLLRCPPEQGADKSRELATGRLTIGRGPDNDWVLQDQERVLSKNHCLVEFKGGVYLVIDSSTNGVFLNDGGDPVGRGNTAILHDGDRLRLGDFLIGVRFVEDAAADDKADPFLAVLKDTGPPSPFAEAAADDDPFAMPAGRRPAMEVMPIPEDDDLFRTKPPASASWGAASDPWRSGDWTPAADPDHGPAETEMMRVGGTAGGAIPDDWDAEPSAVAPPPSLPPSSTPSPPSAALPDDWDDDAPLAPPAFAFRASPAAPVPPPAAPAAEPALALARALAGALLDLARASGRPLPPPFADAFDAADLTARLLAMGPDAAAAAVRTLAAALGGSR